MAFVVPTVGENFCLEKIVNYADAAASDLKLKLYENDVTPGESDTVATYTEVTDGSYAEKTLTGSSWTVAAGNAAYAEQSFTIGGTQAIYGYYLVDNAETTLVLAERFTSTINIGAGGGTVNVTPSIDLD